MEGSPTSLRCLTVRTPLCDGLSLKRQHKSSSKVTKLNLLVNLLRCQLTTVFSIALNRLFDPVLTPFLLQRVGNPLTVRVPGLNLVIRVVVLVLFQEVDILPEIDNVLRAFGVSYGFLSVASEHNHSNPPIGR